MLSATVWCGWDGLAGMKSANERGDPRALLTALRGPSPCEGLAALFERAPIVALVEAHWVEQQHELMRELLFDAWFVEHVDDLAVEFGNASTRSSSIGTSPANTCRNRSSGACGRKPSVGLEAASSHRRYTPTSSAPSAEAAASAPRLGRECSWEIRRSIRNCSRCSRRGTSTSLVW
jgi:hypothetical protein